MKRKIFLEKEHLVNTIIFERIHHFILGKVFRAKNLTNNDQVAIKIMSLSAMEDNFLK